MIKFDQQLENYIIAHTVSEDPVLQRLYRETYLKLVNGRMCSGHLQGSILTFFSRMISPNRILEIGTYTGYSAICLAKGLKSGGKLITIEINDELTGFARSYFINAGVESKVIQITGRAQDIIPSLEKKFDLVFIDGDKREYIEYYKLVIDKVKPGGYILADNILWGGKALEGETNDPQTAGIQAFNEMIRKDNTIEKVTIPLRDGLMLIRKIN